jgi:saccharopine dehydrogenase (NAD+, L-lysine-forming)
MKIFIRKETYSNEFRCPIVPKDIKELKDSGFEVFIESSNNRCYTDEEYCKYGGIIVNDSWFNYNDFIIIGIKELNDIHRLNNHIHIYFSHSYKNQNNSKLILSEFKKSNSILYDLEYFLDDNKRLISFGYYAGIVGGGLGILQYICKSNNKKLNNLKYWRSIEDLLLCINLKKNNIFRNIKICIIGSNGKCGSGVIYILNLLEIPYTYLLRDDDKNKLIDFDIIFNCINLQENISTWFDNQTQFYKNLVIVDISCDYNNPNNPIKIYNNKTTWLEPVFSYNNFVDIIAIDNLPSLLPFNSSIEFSSILIKLLKLYPQNHYYWKNNFEIFKNKINNN